MRHYRSPQSTRIGRPSCCRSTSTTATTTKIPWIIPPTMIDGRRSSPPSKVIDAVGSECRGEDDHCRCHRTVRWPRTRVVGHLLRPTSYYYRRVVDEVADVNRLSRNERRRVGLGVQEEPLSKHHSTAAGHAGKTAIWGCFESAQLRLKHRLSISYSAAAQPDWQTIESDKCLCRCVVARVNLEVPATSGDRVTYLGSAPPKPR